MPICHDLPQEILHKILADVVETNCREEIRYTYGLSEVTYPTQTSKFTRYIRGPLDVESMRWDATRTICEVCSRWLVWSTHYNFKEIREQHRSGSEQWADLTTHRMNYPLYELIDKPRGATVSRKPRGHLKQTEQLLRAFPDISQCIRRLWFNGFRAAETDDIILSIVASCSHLEYLAVPWTTLRRGTV
jgi:hypothetical protein